MAAASGAQLTTKLAISVGLSALVGPWAAPLAGLISDGIGEEICKATHIDKLFDTTSSNLNGLFVNYLSSRVEESPDHEFSRHFWSALKAAVEKVQGLPPDAEEFRQHVLAALSKPDLLTAYPKLFTEAYRPVPDLDQRLPIFWCYLAAIGAGQTNLQLPALPPAFLPAIAPLFESALRTVILTHEKTFRATMYGIPSKLDAMHQDILEIKEHVKPNAPYHRLPNRIPNFTGRNSLLANIETHLKHPGAAALVHGEPGAGKSSVLLEAAHRLALHFHSILHVECGPGATPASIGVKLNALLPHPDPTASPEAQLESVQRWLAAHPPALLVLDDVRSDSITQAFSNTNASILLASHDAQRNYGLAHAFPLEGFTESERIAYLSSTLQSDYATLAPHLAPFAQAFEDHPFPWSLLVGILTKRSAKSQLTRLQEVQAATLSHRDKDLSKYYALAVSHVTPDAQKFLHALAACAPGPAPVSLVLDVAGLPAAQADAITEDLFAAALLRSPGDATVSLHSLLRAWSRTQQGATQLQDRHSRVVHTRFRAWKESTAKQQGETLWRPCLEIESQCLPAIDFTRSAWPYDDFHDISFQIFECMYCNGRLETARQALLRMEQAARAHNDRAGLSRCLGNQALILQDWGQLEQALALLKQEEQICRDLNDRAGLSVSLGNQALILKAWGQLEQALALHKQEEQICRDRNDRASLSVSLGNQARILQAWGQLEQALALHKQKEEICRDRNDRAGLSSSLGNQALILQAWGQLEQALALLKQQEQICRDLNDRAGLSGSLGNQAGILQAWGQLEQALALHKQEEQISRDLNDRAGLSRCLGNQALILQDWGQLEQALALHKQEEQICRDLNLPDGLARSLTSQARILHSQNALPAAQAALSEAESLARTHGRAPLLEIILKIKSTLFP